MYNDFILVGPKEDPAHVQGLPILEALQVIAKGKGIFVSRGDDSGTHKKELELWQKAGIKPQGKWYKAVGKGMGDTRGHDQRIRSIHSGGQGNLCCHENVLP